MTENQIQEFIEWTYDINLQNLSVRLTENESFKEGIEVGIRDTLELMEESAAKEKKVLNELEQWCTSEVCERRDYSASKMLELVIEQIKIFRK